jgi:hypothetical protein
VLSILLCLLEVLTPSIIGSSVGIPIPRWLFVLIPIVSLANVSYRIPKPRMLLVLTLKVSLANIAYSASTSCDYDTPMLYVSYTIISSIPNVTLSSMPSACNPSLLYDSYTITFSIPNVTNLIRSNSGHSTLVM